MRQRTRRNNTYLNIFRSHKRADFDADAYAGDAERMERLARGQKGFVAFRRYTGQDGEALSLSEWETEADARNWASHPDHGAIRARGRSQYYASYIAYSCRDPEVRCFGDHDGR